MEKMIEETRSGNNNHAKKSPLKKTKQMESESDDSVDTYRTERQGGGKKKTPTPQKNRGGFDPFTTEGNIGSLYQIAHGNNTFT